MLHDREFPMRRVGRYELRSWFEPRAFGFLVRWGRLRLGSAFIVQLGPFSVTIEPADEDES